MFNRRIANIRQRFIKDKLDGLLISSVSNITYLTGYSNFFKEERDGFVLITKDKNYILTHSIYSKSLENKISGFDVIEISRRDPPEKVIQNILKKTNPLIGIEEADLRVYEYKKLSKIFKDFKNFDLKIKRSIKDPKEIEFISKACQIGDKAFKQVLKKIKIGMSEKQLVWKLENFIKKQGFETSFRTIIAFGANAFSPHHQPSDKRLTINDQLILMDFGVNYKNYCSDMTRTIFFGKPAEKQKEIYKTVLEAQQKAVDFINDSLKKGKKIMAKDVDKVARKHITSSGYPDIPHSLGHGIGLEVHEHPHLSVKSTEELKEGMVFSIEPGIYISGFGGVRIEDLFVIEKDGLKQITTSPKNLISI